MTQRSASPILRFLRGLAGARAAEGESDACLLERFLGRRDEAAFEALMGRYGRLVLSVCRRILPREQDAEDAFQATFLVLACRAGTIGKREAVASWLYGVAHRIAVKARAGAARRPVPVVLPDVPAGHADEGNSRDLREILDEEIRRLPVRYQAPLVLCYLEGLTTDEAAQQIGCPKGTVLSRLARARDRLRPRLVRRGLTLSAGALAAGLAQEASAAVPAALALATARAALRCAAGPLAAAGVSARVAALARGGLPTMMLSKLHPAVLALLAVAILGAGAAFAYRTPAAGPAAGAGEPAAPAASREPTPADRLLAQVQEQWKRVEERIRDAHPYTDKVTFVQAYEQASKDVQLRPSDLQDCYAQVQKTLAGRKDDAAYTWRAQQLLGRLQVDLKEPDKALAHYRKALSAYPSPTYDEPSKQSSFQHLANETAGVLWRHKGVEEAEKFILQLFAESPKFQYYFHPWWKEHYAEAKEEGRERALVEKVLKIYQDKASKDKDNADLYRKYRRQLQGELRPEPGVQEKKVGGDPRKKYFLLTPPGPAVGVRRPLLLIMPGGDGQAQDFLPFLQRLSSEAGSGYLFAVLSAPQWSAEQAQQIVWPKEKDRIAAATFTTEAFVKAVCEDLAKAGLADPKRVFLFGWSSAGPAVYSTALSQQGPPLAGYYILASVFNPQWLPPLSGARGKRFYLQQGRSDRVTALRFAQKAQQTLSTNGARVKLDAFAGGHAFDMADVAECFQRALAWLEAQD
jgi:RNA polymerase sigma factor (sigma-70 family)